MRSKRVPSARECSERRHLLQKNQFVWMELDAHKVHYPSVTDREEKLPGGLTTHLQLSEKRVLERMGTRWIVLRRTDRPTNANARSSPPQPQGRFASRSAARAV